MEMYNSLFWDKVYRENSAALLGVLRRYVKDMSIAQDLLQEVFITSIVKYDSYGGKGSFEGWMYKIAVNAALMQIRGERKIHIVRDIVETQLATVQQETYECNDDFDDNQHEDIKATIMSADFSSDELLYAIDRLPQHHKLVFNMYVMDKFSHKQIAKELNISAGTSKSHLARARKKIQQFLYEDAMNKQRKKERRRASAILLLFPAKEHYIDKLYCKRFSDFTIQPAQNADFLSSTIAEMKHITPLPAWTAQNASFWGSKISYLAFCGGSAAITGAICWFTMSINSPLNNDNSLNNSNVEIINNEITVGDTLINIPNNINEENNVIFDANFNDEKTAPVVIKKQIIERQTVVVRDTIFINE